MVKLTVKMKVKFALIVENFTVLLAAVVVVSSEDNEIEDKPAKLAGKDGFVCPTNKYDLAIKNSVHISQHLHDGRKFECPFTTWLGGPKPMNAAIFQFMIPDLSNVPKDEKKLDIILPIMKPNFKTSILDEMNFRVTWIGHSTLVIQINGLNILTDPIFIEPIPFIMSGNRRYRRAACEIEELPRIDIVLISHNHRDHLDEVSVNKLNKRFGSQLRWIVPMGVREFLHSLSVENIIELGWWEKDCYQINEAHERDEKHQPSKRSWLDIYLTPAQHWSRRGINDYNKSLWGSYVIISRDGFKFLFTGDTGYCVAFKEINHIFGAFDGAAIPIGAYSPRWFLKSMHINPQEAVQIHQELQSKRSIAIHHSTFILSKEFYLEPVRLLKETMTNLSITEPFTAIKHGESVLFSG